MIWSHRGAIVSIAPQRPTVLHRTCFTFNNFYTSINWVSHAYQATNTNKYACYTNTTQLIQPHNSTTAISYITYTFNGHRTWIHNAYTNNTHDKRKKGKTIYKEKNHERCERGGMCMWMWSADTHPAVCVSSALHRSIGVSFTLQQVFVSVILQLIFVFLLRFNYIFIHSVSFVFCVLFGVRLFPFHFTSYAYLLRSHDFSMEWK